MNEEGHTESTRKYNLAKEKEINYDIIIIILLSYHTMTLQPHFCPLPQEPPRTTTPDFFNYFKKNIQEKYSTQRLSQERILLFFLSRNVLLLTCWLMIRHDCGRGPLSLALNLRPSPDLEEIVLLLLLEYIIITHSTSTAR